MDIEIEAPSACAGVVCGASGYCLEGECICNEGHRSPASCKGGGDCTCSQQTCASVTMYLLCTYYDCVCLLCAYYILTMHLLGARPTASAASSAAPATARAARCRCRCCSPPLAGARPRAPPAPLQTRAASACSVTPRARHAPGWHKSAPTEPAPIGLPLSRLPPLELAMLPGYHPYQACTGPGATECSSCDPIGVTSHLRAGACVDSCGGGYYAEDQPLVRTCQPCHASCQACTGPRASQCSACKPDACAKSNCPPSRKPHLDGSSCLSTCPVRLLSPPSPTAHHPSPTAHRSPLTTNVPPCQAGRYATGRYLGSNTSACLECDSSCTTCTGPSNTECKSCAQSATLSGGVCQLPCADGLWPACEDGECSACENYDCDVCSPTDGTTCLSCKSDWIRPILHNGACVAACPALHTYQPHAKGACTACDDTCGTCDGSSASSCTR